LTFALVWFIIKLNQHPIMKLLNSGNTKTRKGEKLGYITYGMHLAPEKLSGYNVCANASKGCARACLNTAGRGAMSNVQEARIAKTRLFFKDRQKFLDQLWKETEAGIKSALRKSMTPCFRLNLTSDLPWHLIKNAGETILQAFDSVQFYDYTPDPSRFSSFLAGELPLNYHLTFSRKEDNQNVCDLLMADGGNIAAVFRNALPSKWQGRKVVDGDETDLRFLDPTGVIVGLVEKGKAKKDDTGFVISA